MCLTVTLFHEGTWQTTNPELPVPFPLALWLDRHAVPDEVYTLEIETGDAVLVGRLNLDEATADAVGAAWAGWLGRQVHERLLAHAG